MVQDIPVLAHGREENTDVLCTPTRGSAAVSRRVILQRAALFVCAAAGIPAGHACAGERPADSETPRVLLDRLVKVTGNTRIKSSEQGKEALPLMQKYTASLADAGHRFDLKELEEASKLVIQQLYFSQDGIGAATREGAGGVPIAALDMEGALIGYMQRHLPAAGADTPALQEHIDRLRGDLLWYSAYADQPHVWEYAARNYQRCFLPATLDWKHYGAFLEKLSGPNTISSLIVRDTYRRVEGIDSLSRDLPSTGPRGERIARFEDLQKQRRKLHTHLSAPGAERVMTKDDRAAFERWQHEKFIAPCVPPLKRMLTEHLDAEERTRLGALIAEGMMVEGGLPRVVRQVRAWGLRPEDMICALPRPRRGTLNAYPQLGDCSAVFLDSLRESFLFGSESFAEAYDPLSGGNPAAREAFRRNCSGVFLAALARLAAPEDSAEDIALLLKVEYEGRKLRARLSPELPDLALEGERAARFLAVPGGKGSRAADEWMEKRVAMLTELLATGYTYGEGSGETEHIVRCPGIFAQYDDRIVARTCDEMQIVSPERRAKVAGSLLHRDRVRSDRLGFLASFRDAAPQLRNQVSILRGWGFTPDELVGANISDPRPGIFSSFLGGKR